MTNRKIEYWVIPPEADGEFVADMEVVLETYAQPYDRSCPVIVLTVGDLKISKQCEQKLLLGQSMLTEDNEV